MERRGEQRTGMNPVLRDRGIDYVTWKKVAKRQGRADAAIDAFYQRESDRTPEQMKVAREVILLQKKVDRRKANWAIAHGTGIHTSNGSRTRIMPRQERRA